jgi:hypothetical protein
LAETYTPLVEQTQAALKDALELPFATRDERIENARRLLNAHPLAQGLPVWSDEDSRRALVGALGLGMAMLAPLLQDVRVTCAPIALDPRDSECASAMARLVDAFGRCTAVRLSEACLLVSEHVRF